MILAPAIPQLQLNASTYHPPNHGAFPLVKYIRGERRGIGKEKCPTKPNEASR